MIAQHRQDDGRDGALEHLLDARCALDVREAEDKQELAPGAVVVAPAGYHLLVERGSVSLSVDEPLHFSRPSIDVLLGSAADAYGDRAAGVVLTGANADGAHGLAKIAARGGVDDRAGPRDGRAARDARSGAVGDAGGAGARARADRPGARRARGQARPVAAMRDARSDTAILLVDDHEENLLALEAILEPTGYRLVRARSGDEALKALLRDEFAVILLDVQMPGIDGFETAELIRARERTRSVPIIFVTAISTTAEHVFRGYESGAVDYLFKPVDPHILRSKVEVFGELYERGRALAEREEQLRATFEDAPIGMARADPDGRIRHVNRALEETLGRGAAELIGRTLDELGPHADVGIDAGAPRGAHVGRDPPVRGRAPAHRPARDDDPGARQRLARAPGTRLAGRPVGPHPAAAGPARAPPRAARPRAAHPRAVGARRGRGGGRAPAGHAVDRRRGARRRGSGGAPARAAGPHPRGARRRPGGRGADRRGAADRRARRPSAWRRSSSATRASRSSTASSTASRASAGRSSVADVPADGIDAGSLGGAITSLLAVPLLDAGRVIGSIQVGTLTRRDFDAETIGLLRLAADRAGLAIGRMRLFERERRIAQELQRSLLPKRLPDVAGVALGARYEPGENGTAVGGDWYDAIALPSGRVALAIGDVVGRGIEAAATMGQMRSALRAILMQADDTGKMADRLNRFTLALGSDEAIMTTVVLAILEPGTGTLRFTNAGHPPPLLVRADGSAAYLDEPPSPPMGVLATPRYQQHTARAGARRDARALHRRARRGADRGARRRPRAAARRGDARWAPTSRRPCELLLDSLRDDTARSDDVTLLVVRLQETLGATVSLEVSNESGGLFTMRQTLRRWLVRAGRRRRRDRGRDHGVQRGLRERRRARLRLRRRPLRRRVHA